MVDLKTVSEKTRKTVFCNLHMMLRFLALCLQWPTTTGFCFHVCHYCGLILILTFYVAIGREETKIKLSFSYVLGTRKEFNKINSVH